MKFIIKSNKIKKNLWTSTESLNLRKRWSCVTSSHLVIVYIHLLSKQSCLYAYYCFYIIVFITHWQQICFDGLVRFCVRKRKECSVNNKHIHAHLMDRML